MNLNWKKFGLIGITCVSCICLMTGCIKEYTRDDIKKYVKEECELNKFNVSKEPVEIEDKEGYTDLLWTITLKGDEGLKFHVLDDHGWGMESASNYLRTDYSSVLLKQYAKDYNKFKNIQVKEYADEGQMYDARLEGMFSNRIELRQLFEELLDFKFYVSSKEGRKRSEFRYKLKFDNPLRYKVTNVEDNHVVDDGDYSGGVTDCNQKVIQKAEKVYLQTCLDYQFKENLLEFTNDEIEKVVQESEDQIGVLHSKEGEDYVYYTDLLANKRGYGISFGTLYEILKREGYDVQGNEWNYSFVSNVGDQYQISYDFCMNNPDESNKKWYYYFKNNQIIWMRANFYNHFTESEIREMTGLTLNDGRELEQPAQKTD